MVDSTLSIKPSLPRGDYLTASSDFLELLICVGNSELKFHHFPRPYEQLFQLWAHIGPRPIFVHKLKMELGNFTMETKFKGDYVIGDMLSTAKKNREICQKSYSHSNSNQNSLKMAFPQPVFS